MYFHHGNRIINPISLEQINSDEGRYYLTPEGNRYPSITTVLSEYSKQGIQEWRDKVGDDAADTIMRKAATRGTNIHSYCEKFLKNEIPDILSYYEQELFESIKPELFRIDNIHVQEHRLYSDHLRLAGTVDCVAEFDNKLSIIDFKTARKQKKKEYIENYFMQCSAYAIMFEERYKIPVSQTVLIIAVEDDKPQVFVEKRDNYVKSLIYYRDLYEKQLTS